MEPTTVQKIARCDPAEQSGLNELGRLTGKLIKFSIKFGN